MSVQGAVPAWLQITWAIAGIGVAVGGFLWVVIVFYPYILFTKRMMVKSIELGEKTANHLVELQRDVGPLIVDAKAVIASVRTLVDDIQRQDPRRLVEFVDKLARDGTLDRITGSLEKIADRVHGAIDKVEQRRVGEMVDRI